MALVPQQWEFLQDLASLIQHAAKLDGVMLTGGDLWQDNHWHEANSIGGKTPHLKKGQHPKRLAVDLNLFVGGKYVSGYHPIWDELGTHWESLDKKNRWGGRFSNVKDYNHFERVAS